MSFGKILQNLLAPGKTLTQGGNMVDNVDQVISPFTNGSGFSKKSPDQQVGQIFDPINVFGNKANSHYLGESRNQMIGDQFANDPNNAPPNLMPYATLGSTYNGMLPKPQQPPPNTPYGTPTNY